jgi:hypothetical protein
LTTAKASTRMAGRSTPREGKTLTRRCVTAVARAFSAVAILSGATVRFAGPSAAVDLLGIYDFRSDSGETSIWTATPCGPGCVNVGVTNMSPNWNERFTGQARVDGGQWYMRVDVRYAVRCEINEQIYPGQFEFVWDAPTLNGTMVAIQTTPNCGRPGMARTAATAFALTRRPAE